MFWQSATVFAAWSRTAVLAGGAAAAFLLMDRLLTRAGIAAAMAGAALVLFGAITFGITGWAMTSAEACCRW